jgi:hypothetical protein
MIQGIKDYAKCVVANKFTLGGYIGIALFPLIEYAKYKTKMDIPLIGDILFLTGLWAFNSTHGGYQTYKAYGKVKKHIKENGILDPRYKSKFSSEYCIQAGLRTAIKEAGLEKIV